MSAFSPLSSGSNTHGTTTPVRGRAPSRISVSVPSTSTSMLVTGHLSVYGNKCGGYVRVFVSENGVEYTLDNVDCFPSQSPFVTYKTRADIYSKEGNSPHSPHSPHTPHSLTASVGSPSSLSPRSQAGRQHSQSRSRSRSRSHSRSPSRSPERLEGGRRESVSSVNGGMSRTTSNNSSGLIGGSTRTGSTNSSGLFEGVAAAPRPRMFLREIIEVKWETLTVDKVVRAVLHSALLPRNEKDMFCLEFSRNLCQRDNQGVRSQAYLVTVEAVRKAKCSSNTVRHILRNVVLDGAFLSISALVARALLRELPRGDVWNQVPWDEEMCKALTQSADDIAKSPYLCACPHRMGSGIAKYLLSHDKLPLSAIPSHYPSSSSLSQLASAASVFDRSIFRTTKPPMIRQSSGEMRLIKQWQSRFDIVVYAAGSILAALELAYLSSNIPLMNRQTLVALIDWGLYRCENDLSGKVKSILSHEEFDSGIIVEESLKWLEEDQQVRCFDNRKKVCLQEHAGPDQEFLDVLSNLISRIPGLTVGAVDRYGFVGRDLCNMVSWLMTRNDVNEFSRAHLKHAKSFNPTDFKQAMLDRTSNPKPTYPKIVVVTKHLSDEYRKLLNIDEVAVMSTSEFVEMDLGRWRRCTSFVFFQISDMSTHRIAKTISALASVSEGSHALKELFFVDDWFQSVRSLENRRALTVPQTLAKFTGHIASPRAVYLLAVLMEYGGHLVEDTEQGHVKMCVGFLAGGRRKAKTSRCWELRRMLRAAAMTENGEALGRFFYNLDKFDVEMLYREKNRGTEYEKPNRSSKIHTTGDHTMIFRGANAKATVDEVTEACRNGSMSMIVYTVSQQKIKDFQEKFNPEFPAEYAMLKRQWMWKGMIAKCLSLNQYVTIMDIQQIQEGHDALQYVVRTLNMNSETPNTKGGSATPQVVSETDLVPLVYSPLQTRENLPPADINVVLVDGCSSRCSCGEACLVDGFCCCVRKVHMQDVDGVLSKGVRAVVITGKDSDLAQILGSVVKIRSPLEEMTVAKLELHRKKSASPVPTDADTPETDASDDTSESSHVYECLNLVPEKDETFYEGSPRMRSLSMMMREHINSVDNILGRTNGDSIYENAIVSSYPPEFPDRMVSPSLERRGSVFRISSRTMSIDSEISDPSPPNALPKLEVCGAGSRGRRRSSCESVSSLDSIAASVHGSPARRRSSARSDAIGPLDPVAMVVRRRSSATDSAEGDLTEHSHHSRKSSSGEVDTLIPLRRMSTQGPRQRTETNDIAPMVDRSLSVPLQDYENSLREAAEHARTSEPQSNISEGPDSNTTGDHYVPALDVALPTMITPSKATITDPAKYRVKRIPKCVLESFLIKKWIQGNGGVSSPALGPVDASAGVPPTLSQSSFKFKRLQSNSISGIHDRSPSVSGMNNTELSRLVAEALLKI